MIHSIVLDLTAYGLQVVEVAHNDTGSRRVACRLRANGEPWAVPEGAAVSVSYTLGSGVPGLYADPAAEIGGSTVTINLSDQILSSTGTADASVVLTKDGVRLASFPFRVRVVGNNPLSNPVTYPALGAEFEGRLFLGGPGGTAIPLKLGAEFFIRDGELHVSGGAGEPDPPEDPETPLGVVEVSVDGDGILHVYLDGAEVFLEIDADGLGYWPGMTASLDADGYLIIEKE